MIEEHNPFLAIIFCRTKRRATTLNEALLAHGYQSDELHGDLSQAKREAVMKRFREAKLQLLVATDVAARGWTSKALPMSLTTICPMMLKVTSIASAGPDGRG